jgi:transposase
VRNSNQPQPAKRGRPVCQGKRAENEKGCATRIGRFWSQNAAGINIGAREIFVAAPPERDKDPVRIFSTFTEDLNKMAQWLVRCGITTVAMEFTGVYWIPAYDVVEQHGLKPCLVNTGNMKNVPGRRTDWHECQWLQFLHSVGLLRAAFRPEGAVTAVRALMRHRSDLVLMTNPAVLSQLRDQRIKASEETIRKSLVGNWRPEHLFTPRQSREMYRRYQEQIAACDEEIEKLIVTFEPRVNPDERPLPPDRKQKQRRSKSKTVNPTTGFDVRTESYKLFGVDLTQVPGLAKNVPGLFTEVGTCRDGQLRRSSSRGRRCVRTTISVAEKCFGEAREKCTTELRRCFDWRLTPYTMTKRRWATTSAG